MPEFEEQSCDVVAVSADSRGKACSFVRRAAGPAAGCGRQHAGLSRQAQHPRGLVCVSAGMGTMWRCGLMHWGRGPASPASGTGHTCPVLPCKQLRMPGPHGCRSGPHARGCPRHPAEQRREAAASASRSLPAATGHTAPCPLSSLRLMFALLFPYSYSVRACMPPLRTL